MSEASPPLDVEQRIYCDGFPLVDGQGTLGVVFNILAGHLIKDPAGLHDFMLHLCEANLAEVPEPGSRITLVSGHTKIIECTIGQSDAPIYTRQLEYEVLRAEFEKAEAAYARLEAEHQAQVEHYMVRGQTRKRRANCQPPHPPRGLSRERMKMELSPFKRDASGVIVLRSDEDDSKPWSEEDTASCTEEVGSDLQEC